MFDPAEHAESNFNLIRPTPLPQGTEKSDSEGENHDFMKALKEFFLMPGVRRALALILAVVLLISLKSMLNLLLITFILTYLMNRLHLFIRRGTDRIKLNSKLVLVLIYALLVFALGFGIYRYLPVFIFEIQQLITQVISFYNNLSTLVVPDNAFTRYIMDSIKEFDIASYVQGSIDFLVHTLTDIGKLSLHLLIAFILSLFFNLEKDKVASLMSKFRYSKAAYFFTELEYFGRKFISSFGKVLEVQFMIALTNALLSLVFLWIFGFPNLIALGLMIFLLGLVPVMGVVVSLIPLCAIAFNIGGLQMILYVLIMIVVLHAFEAYILNPKFMSNKTHLPIFFTFLILLLGEHFLGVWGLIVGVPIFIFLLDILEVPLEPEGKTSKLKKNEPPAMPPRIQ
ncbi:AI-2E family transporter [Saccharibacillus kuerlensis]|uniref:AI-2E family transporter n=1 Tax=Saccharibacillus kuerlensis TaxID=459527 RepID=A0ABQ2KS44_9BACL|nr:AI-2E family transporter [Saccharibacillus kuerlensis]GGN91679.1 AI-2E family transporter [Saccharibacillus kuerlensis]